MAAKKSKKSKKKTKKKAAKSTKQSAGSKALEFARAFLRRKPQATFSDIKTAANKKKITIYPITYGRAKALEGLVKVSAYGTKKKSKRGPGRPKGSKNKRGPGRPRKVAAGLDSIESLVSTIKTLQRERDDALKAIEKIRNLLATL